MLARLHTHFCFALLVPVIGPLLVTPCSAGKLRAEAQPGADFAHYKTFRWLPTRVLGKTGVVEDDPVLGPAIKSAINRQLTQRGMTEVSENADLEISAGVLTASNPQLEAVIFPGYLNMTYATPVATMGRYNKEGTLVVNLIDTRSKKSAWIGMITESLDNKVGSGEKKLPSAADKLFKKYPVKK